MPAPISTYQAHIANGQTTSSEAATTNGGLYVEGNAPARLRMPATFTGTAVTFLESPDDASSASYLAVKKDDGTTYTVTVAANGSYALDPTLFLGVGYVKIVSNASEGGARVLTVMARPL